MVKGIWVGRHDEGGDHLMLAQEFRRAKEVTRLDPLRRADRSLLKSNKGFSGEETNQSWAVAASDPFGGRASCDARSRVERKGALEMPPGSLEVPPGPPKILCERKGALEVPPGPPKRRA